MHHGMGWGLYCAWIKRFNRVVSHGKNMHYTHKITSPAPAATIVSKRLNVLPGRPAEGKEMLTEDNLESNIIEMSGAQGRRQPGQQQRRGLHELRPTEGSTDISVAVAVVMTVAGTVTAAVDILSHAKPVTVRVTQKSAVMV